MVDDPVLVRAGHTMQATPWAEQVQTEVRTLLHRTHAVLAKARPLDLANLERTFTIMPTTPTSSRSAASFSSGSSRWHLAFRSGSWPSRPVTTGPCVTVLPI